MIMIAIVIQLQQVVVNIQMFNLMDEEDLKGMRWIERKTESMGKTKWYINGTL